MSGAKVLLAVDRAFIGGGQRTVLSLARGLDKDMFEVTVASHEAALAALRPGSTGLAVDTAARRVIEAAGFAGYRHAAGHGLGRKVHDVGPLLGPDWPERYGSLVRAEIEEGQVLAVEPMVYATVETSRHASPLSTAERS